MLRLKFELCVVLFLTHGFLLLNAQESVNVSGGNASGGGGFSSYSVGQLVYFTNTGSNGTVAQGVQQPYEISVVTGLDETKTINLLFSVYPNPATDILTLEVKDVELKNLRYLMFDINGKLLQNGLIIDNKTEIYMANLLPAIYFVTILQDTKEFKTFKIIKN
jgi:hypothetical protein